MINQTEAAIQLQGLTKRYGKTTAVEDLSLVIPRGSTFGLLGPNGAGKSSTIKMLMGMLSIDAGTATVLGINVADSPSAMKQRVGYVPELHHIYRWMTVRKVIGFVKSFYPSWNDELCDELLDLFELPIDRKVAQLSKGMVAKLSLLLAMSHEPELLVLDEPMSGLDPLVREEFLDGVLRTICRGDSTVLFSSHSIDDVQRLADDVGIMYHGRLLVNRPLDDLLGSTKRVRAVLRDGCLPQHLPEGTIWQSVQRREWSLTVAGFSTDVLTQLRAENSVEVVDVADLCLEDLFKDYVKGAKTTI
ncbi:ABC transporter ATP-binding protein [Symmachiella dynata]|uniref:ABC transporter ATP-binding protein YtrB n=1 Tax=Symmachiella dynata TaxID=2527995 RepID=A0A517ZV61_9PLAN|nr:ABC transporter ATP-binding protein [Symmachiella dynata]QDU46335.1 ABC transporter ATP-binding protein YtrB [Symmachiella dynata]